jgi:hypothetical protein
MGYRKIDTSNAFSKRPIPIKELEKHLSPAQKAENKRKRAEARKRNARVATPCVVYRLNDTHINLG